MASAFDHTQACSSSPAAQHVGVCGLLGGVGALERNLAGIECTCAQALDDALDSTLITLFQLSFKLCIFYFKGAFLP